MERALKIFLSILLIKAVVAIGFPAVAQELKGAKSGEEVTAGNYCFTPEAADFLAEITKEKNDVGYMEVMNDPEVMCVDSRLHPVPALPSVLVEKRYSITREDGQIYEFWTAVSPMVPDTIYIWIWVGNESKV